MTGLPHPDHLHTIEQASQALNVPAATISMWKKRELVMPADYLPEKVRAGKQRPLFRLDELRPRAEAYHRRVASRSTTSTTEDATVETCPVCGLAWTSKTESVLSERLCTPRADRDEIPGQRSIRYEPCGHEA